MIGNSVTGRGRRAHPDPGRGPAAGRPRWKVATTRTVPLLIALAVLVTVLLVAGTPAWAQAPEQPGVASIPEVVNRMRLWLLGLLAAVATFYLSLGGFRYLWSNGDPGEVEKAKSALRNAAIGYAAAILAPLFVTIVTGFVA